MKKTKIASILAVAALALPLSAFAAEQDVTVSGGVLSSSNTPIAFSSVTLDLAQNQTSTASSVLSVKDDRGSGAGWSISLDISDFKSTSLADPSSGGAGQYVVKIPASAVEVQVTNATKVAGQEVDPTNGPNGSQVTLSNTPQHILNASPGFGMGSYTSDAAFTLSVPKTVEIDSLSGSGSKYQAGDNVGTVAGTYTSTFTFTQTAGI